jgi:hypothetical protein
MAVLLWALYRQTRIVAHGHLAAAEDGERAQAPGKEPGLVRDIHHFLLNLR